MPAGALLQQGRTKQLTPGLEVDLDVADVGASSYLRVRVLDDRDGRHVLLYSTGSGGTKTSVLVTPRGRWLWSSTTGTRRMSDRTYQFPGTSLLLEDLLLLDPAQHVVVGEVPDTVRGVSCLVVTLDPLARPASPPARRTLSLALDAPREGLPVRVREFDLNGAPFRTVEHDDWRSLGGAGGAWLAHRRDITDVSLGLVTSIQVTHTTLGNLSPRDFSTGHLQF